MHQAARRHTEANVLAGWMGNKMVLGLPLAHIPSYFADNRHRRHDIDAIDLGQVRSRCPHIFVSGSQSPAARPDHNE